MVILGALILLQRAAQLLILRVQLLFGRGELIEALVCYQQIAAQQLAVALFEGFAHLQQGQSTLRGMQGVAHQVMRALQQLLLDGVVQAIARFGFHQAGVGGVHQCTEIAGADT